MTLRASLRTTRPQCTVLKVMQQHIMQQQNYRMHLLCPQGRVRVSTFCRINLSFLVLRFLPPVHSPFLIAYKHSNRYSFCWNVQVFPGLWSQLMYHLLLSLLSMVCKQPSAVWNSVVASTNCQRWVRKTQICYHPAEEKTCFKFA